MQLQEFCKLLHEVMQTTGKLAYGVMTMEVSFESIRKIELSHVLICVTAVHHKNNAHDPSGFLHVKKIPTTRQCRCLADTTKNMWAKAAVSYMIAQPVHTAPVKGSHRSSLSFEDLSEQDQCNNETCWTEHCMDIEHTVTTLQGATRTQEPLHSLSLYRSRACTHAQTH